MHYYHYDDDCYYYHYYNNNNKNYYYYYDHYYRYYRYYHYYQHFDGELILIDSDVSLSLSKFASDQLRQICLSQLAASDRLRQI